MSAGLTPKLLTSGKSPTWCPGCGDFSVLAATKEAIVRNGYRLEEVAAISGIGCSSNWPHFLKTYGFHGIHGRLLPLATGVHLANPKLKVLGAGGDGDGLAIGMGHFIHAMRRNLDLTYLIMDNQIYGLTVGQASPTSLMEQKTRSTPTGNYEYPINPVALAITSGATFVARTFSKKKDHMVDIIARAMEHKGFSFIDALSPCVTFNQTTTYDWFGSRVFDLQESGHDSSDPLKAYAVAQQDWGTWEAMPIGVFYEVQKPTYTDMEIGYTKGYPIDAPMTFAGMGYSKEQVLAEFY